VSDTATEELTDEQQSARNILDKNAETVKKAVKKVKEEGTLAALETEETAGKGRTSVLKAIAARREALAEKAGVEPEEPEAAGGPAMTTVLMPGGGATPDQPQPTPEEVDKRSSAMVSGGKSSPMPKDASTSDDGELIEVIRPGFWVRLAAAKGVPAHLVGRDGVVQRAPVYHAEGGDKHSPIGYEYQKDDTQFFVKMRDTGETLALTRDAFAVWDTDEVRLNQKVSLA